jgi:hypothetical protein
MLSHRRVGVAAFLCWSPLLPLAWFVGEISSGMWTPGRCACTSAPAGTASKRTERIFGLVEGNRRDSVGTLEHLDNIGLRFRHQPGPVTRPPSGPVTEKS